MRSVTFLATLSTANLKTTNQSRDQTTQSKIQYCEDLDPTQCRIQQVIHHQKCLGSKAVGNRNSESHDTMLKEVSLMSSSVISCNDIRASLFQHCVTTFTIRVACYAT